jgi:hypothetical protein
LQLEDSPKELWPAQQILLVDKCKMVRGADLLGTGGAAVDDLGVAGLEGIVYVVLDALVTPDLTGIFEYADHYLDEADKSHLCC